MSFPDFFAAVPTIRLQDPLAAFLGASSNGIIEYGYADAVKLAGHSCPTVAAAYGMTRAALAALYGDQLPQRGEIAVAFREPADAGVTGVIANVASMLTGAAAEGGFKGLAGRFVRRGLLSFGAAVPLEARFTRLDTGAAVDVGSNLRDIPAHPELPEVMQRAIANAATPDEAGRFGRLWQERVRRILLEHADDASVFIVRSTAST
jgi:formylmethanofuran dehydrogenase subunit E